MEQIFELFKVNQDEFLRILLSSFIIAAILGVFQSLAKLSDLRSKKKEQVNLSETRKLYESKINDIQEKLIANEERWRDINHLLLRDEIVNGSVKNSGFGRPIKINTFLRANGLTEKDLRIDTKQVFVLTSFHHDFDDIFSVIKETCAKYGFKCIRGDEKFIAGDIFPSLLREIVKSSFIIANINGRNPNVMYELGIAQALDKPTILIAKGVQGLPFDIKSRRFLIYRDIEQLIKLLESEISKLYNT